MARRRRRPFAAAVATVAMVAVGALAAGGLPAGAMSENATPDDGTHPYVVALMIGSPGSGEAFPFCSGALVRPTVVLTASHCTWWLQPALDQGAEVWVTNADDLPLAPSGNVVLAQLPANTLERVAAQKTHPAYKQPYNEDVAALVLTEPLVVAGPLPTLAPIGFLDTLRQQKTLRTTPMIVVGYGSETMVNGPGGPVFPDSGERRYAELFATALDREFVHQAQRVNQGSAGACYGDSGGPTLVTTGGITYVVAVTSTGDFPCWATNVASRVDRVSARNWIDQVIADAGA